MKHRYLVSLCVVMLFGFGCAPPPGNGPDTTCDPMAAQVTMTQLQTALFDGKCKSCHSPASAGVPEGTGFAYGDYTSVAKTYAMVNKPSLFKGSGMTLKIVEPNNLANSSLWLKLSTKVPTGFPGPKGELTGRRMPDDGTPITAAELKQVKDWICTGAAM